jgi:hypothetical protein
MTDLALNQLITIVFETDEPKWRVIVVALDAADDNAADATEQWRDGAFNIDDLLGSFQRTAQIEVTENGRTEHYTGEQFDAGAVLRELDGVEPARVTFADLEAA